MGGGNYTGRVVAAAAVLLTVLIGVSFVPAFSVGALHIKRVDILSDFRPTRGEIIKTGVSSEKSLDTSFLADAPRELNVATQNLARQYTVPVVKDANLVAIEDFSAGGQMMARFYDALLNEAATRTVHIAVCGDSFIESDILTADIREQLQQMYGGGGVGFVPFATPLSGYRSTVKHTWSDWTVYNLLKKRNTPQKYQGDFAISGLVCVPQAGATSRWTGTNFRTGLSTVQSAQLIFTNRAHSQISVSVNGGAAQTYTPPTSPKPQRITIHGNISSMTAKILNPDGFVGYGVVLEDTLGVSVHNFSVRSSSGLPLFGTSTEVNSTINALEKYDLIILQYGLNVMEARVSDYRFYGEQLQKIIAYLRGSFPQAAIIVLGVSDRCSVVGGVPVSMPVADAMERAQRDAAQMSGVAFWSTRRAMQRLGGMAHFVEQRWAARDYTHIGYNGGRQLAHQFTDYVAAATESVRHISDVLSGKAVYVPDGDAQPLMPTLYPLPRLFSAPARTEEIPVPTREVTPTPPEPQQQTLPANDTISPRPEQTQTDTVVAPPAAEPPHKPTISIVPVIENGEVIRIDTLING